MKEKNILFAISDIDEKYIEDARPRGRRRKAVVRYLTVAASLAIVIGLSVGMLAVFGGAPGGSYDDGPSGIQGGPSGSDEGESGGGEPSGPQGPSAETPGDRYSEYYAGENYSRLMAILGSFDGDGDGFYLQGDVESGGFEADKPEGGDASVNGSFIDVTENQVEGVEEPDKLKMTDKYLFYLGDKSNGFGEALYIYSLEGEESKEVCYYPLPVYDGSPYSDESNKIFLSDDATTLFIIKNYRGKDDPNSTYKTTVTLLDVSDVTSPKEVKYITLGGCMDYARMVGGRLLIGTTFLSTKYKFEWTDPDVYLPYYEIGEEKSYFDPEDIICPDELSYKSYSSIFILDEELNVISNKAVFDVSGVYGECFVSNDKIVYSLGYAVSQDNVICGSDCKSNIVVIDYTSDSLKVQRILKADGWIMDRFFVDEKDDYLRFITNSYKNPGWNWETENSSLYIYDLKKGEYTASVVNFAPDGEGATAVRFDGDKCYVCTAEIKTYTDPVYFFDLSDYSNITQVNTGFIDGFSTNLIEFGDGLLLGIGELSFQNGKVSIYKREGNVVITLAEYLFEGKYAHDRKAYLIDRENGLFGFFSGSNISTSGTYHLLHFDGTELSEIYSEKINHGGYEIRSVYYKEHLYILEVYDLTVKKITVD